MGRWIPRIQACQHPIVVTVISGGLERGICEECGNITVRYESSISGHAVRENFARDADDNFLKSLIELAVEESDGETSSSGDAFRQN